MEKLNIDDDVMNFLGRLNAHTHHASYNKGLKDKKSSERVGSYQVNVNPPLWTGTFNGDLESFDGKFALNHWNASNGGVSLGMYLEMSGITEKAEMRAFFYLTGADFMLEGNAGSGQFDSIGISLNGFGNKTTLVFTGTSKKQIIGIEKQKTAQNYEESSGFYVCPLGIFDIWGDLKGNQQEAGEKLKNALESVMKIKNVSYKGTVRMARILLEAYKQSPEEDQFKIAIKSKLKEQWSDGQRKVPNFKKEEISAELDPILEKAWELWEAADPSKPEEEEERDAFNDNYTGILPVYY